MKILRRAIESDKAPDKSTKVVKTPPLCLLEQHIRGQFRDAFVGLFSIEALKLHVRKFTYYGPIVH